MKATREKKGGKLAGTKHGAQEQIKNMIEKYGDTIAVIRDIDRKPGSPTQFKVDNNRMVFWLALAGMTEYEMANVLGIPDTTFVFWKKTRPEFMKALNLGRQESAGVCAHSLFKAANGFEKPAVKLIPNRVREYHPDTGKISKEYTEVIHETYMKYYPPNVTALLRFLAVKLPDIWGDKQETNNTFSFVTPVDVKKLKKKELKILKKMAKSRLEDAKILKDDAEEDFESTG